MPDWIMQKGSAHLLKLRIVGQINYLTSYELSLWHWSNIRCLRQLSFPNKSILSFGISYFLPGEFVVTSVKIYALARTSEWIIFILTPNTVHYVYSHFFYSDFVYSHFVYSQHRSWVLIRTASNRACDLCFEQKLRKIIIFHQKITIFTGLKIAVYCNHASGHVIALLFIANRLPKIKEKFSFKIRKASH